VKRFVITTGACAALLGATAGEAYTNAPTLQRQTIYLDSYSRAARNAGPVATRLKLASRTWYVVTVKGTFSLDVFRPRVRRHRTDFCGPAEDRPQRRSRNRPVAPVFVDAEMEFALPREWVDRAQQCATLPNHTGGFQMTAGRRFRHVEPIGGAAPVTTAQDHAYRYLLRGAGRVARFRIKDANPRDNSGVLTIGIRPAQPSEIPAPPAPIPPPPAPVPPPPAVG
jgi:hypothetical protein